MFSDLVAKEELRLKKLVALKKAEANLGGLDPYDSDDGDKMKALAASFEEKYAEKPKSKKMGKLGGKKRKIHEYDDLGEGYDESDPFIDNSECFDEVVPQEITTAHGGFYINTGALEFKSNKSAVFELSSDEESSAVDSTKTKKLKKDPVKKKVQFKDGNETKKPKGLNSGAKRKARVINTDKNIKGPRIITTDKNIKGPNINNVKKNEISKVETKKLVVELKNVSDMKKTEKITVSATPSMKSEKTAPTPKTPEILNLEAQLEALSKSVEISKNESKPVKKPNASLVKSTQSPKSVQKTENGTKPGDSPLPKLPPGVKVTRLENSPKSKSNAKTVEGKPTVVTPKSSGAATVTKSGWQNQISFPPSSVATSLPNSVSKATVPSRSLPSSVTMSPVPAPHQASPAHLQHLQQCYHVLLTEL